MAAAGKDYRRGSIEVVLLVVFVTVLVGVLGYVAVNRFAHKPASQAAVVTKPTAAISGATFATAIDASGAAIKPMTTFAASEKTIMVVADLSETTPAARVAYTRYLNDKFIDNGSIPAGKEGAKHVSFAFTQSAGKARLPGTYKIKLYANGKFAKEATYTVK